jgi:hypothetical protein
LRVCAPSVGSPAGSLNRPAMHAGACKSTLQHHSPLLALPRLSPVSPSSLPRLFRLFDMFGFCAYGKKSTPYTRIHSGSWSVIQCVMQLLVGKERRGGELGDGSHAHRYPAANLALFPPPSLFPPSHVNSPPPSVVQLLVFLLQSEEQLELLDDGLQLLRQFVYENPLYPFARATASDWDLLSAPIRDEPLFLCRVFCPLTPTMWSVCDLLFKSCGTFANDYITSCVVSDDCGISVQCIVDPLCRSL